MKLFEKLKKAKSEEDIKDTFIEALRFLKIGTKQQHLSYTMQKNRKFVNENE